MFKDLQSGLILKPSNKIVEEQMRKHTEKYEEVKETKKEVEELPKKVSKEK